jgi:hypothetical protein
MVLLSMFGRLGPFGLVSKLFVVLAPQFAVVLGVSGLEVSMS